MKKILYVVILATLLLSMVGCAPGAQPAAEKPAATEPATAEPVAGTSDRPEILKEADAKEGDSDVVIIGLTVSGRPPRAFYPDADPSKPVEGYEPEILEELAKRANLDIVYYEVAWSGLFTGLLANKWDVGASDVFIKKERDDMMDFSEPHLDSDLAI